MGFLINQDPAERRSGRRSRERRNSAAAPAPRQEILFSKKYEV